MQRVPTCLLAVLLALTAFAGDRAAVASASSAEDPAAWNIDFAVGLSARVAGGGDVLRSGENYDWMASFELRGLRRRSGARMSGWAFGPGIRLGIDNLGPRLGLTASGEYPHSWWRNGILRCGAGWYVFGGDNLDGRSPGGFVEIEVGVREVGALVLAVEHLRGQDKYLDMDLGSRVAVDDDWTRVLVGLKATDQYGLIATAGLVGWLYYALAHLEFGD